MRRNLSVFIRLFLGLALSSIFTASLSFAQNSDANQTNAQEYVGEAAKLLSIFDSWAEASTACNYSALRELYHDKVTFWPSVAKEPFYGEDAVIEVFEGMCKINSYLRVTPVDRYVDLLDDTAVVFGSLRFRRMLNEQLTEIPVRFSFTLIKQKNEWKILHMQSVTVPFSPKESVSEPDQQ